MTQAFPLQWPSHTPRSRNRRDGAFTMSFAAALDDARRQIELAGGKGLVVSTNIPMRQDGTGPLKGQAEPHDPGVAVYFMRRGSQVCFACDKFIKVRANMRAIGKTIEAIRGIERWGSVEMMDQAFSGFVSLPSPDAMHWWTLLGVPSTSSPEVIAAAYKTKARELGATGNDAARAELNIARDQAMKDRT